MGERVRQLNKALKAHDSRLFAVQASTGVIHVLRRAEKWDAADAIEFDEFDRNTRPQFILATTEDWTMSGRPVEWGLEPIMTQLRSMDSWQRSSRPLEQVRRNREVFEANRKRARLNEYRAIAADCRRDFAKVTNDFRIGGN